jgi:hypothetical protein
VQHSILYAVTRRVDLERQHKEKTMGRPLRKDVLGIDAIGTYAGANTGIRVELYDGSLRTDGVILKQRGAKTFQCTRVGTIGTSSTYDHYVLQDSAPNAANEMRMFGYLNTNSGTQINIRKITKRVATDFSGNRYTWVLQNDSSNDYIVLTAI